MQAWHPVSAERVDHASNLRRRICRNATIVKINVGNFRTREVEGGKRFQKCSASFAVQLKPFYRRKKGASRTGAPFNVVTMSGTRPDWQSDSFLPVSNVGARGPVRSSRHAMSMREEHRVVKFEGYGQLSEGVRSSSAGLRGSGTAQSRHCRLIAVEHANNRPRRKAW